jgi:hypothetical protein
VANTGVLREQGQRRVRPCRYRVLEALKTSEDVKNTVRLDPGFELAPSPTNTAVAGLSGGSVPRRGCLLGLCLKPQVCQSIVSGDPIPVANE